MWPIILLSAVCFLFAYIFLALSGINDWPDSLRRFLTYAHIFCIGSGLTWLVDGLLTLYWIR